MSHVPPRENPPPYSEAPENAPAANPNTTALGPVVVINHVGPNPAKIVCKSCNSEVVTAVKSRPTMRTHIIALILCLIGCWPCVCIPYCVKSCTNADHYCPSCNAYIGSYVN